MRFIIVHPITYAISIADVIDIISEIHSCLNRIIGSMKPATCPRKPEGLFHAVKYAVCEAAVGK